MSGGYFDFKQRSIKQVAESVKVLIQNEKSGNSLARSLSSVTIAEFEQGVLLLEQAAIYAQRIDWLISDDDDEDTFHERLEAELAAT